MNAARRFAGLLPHAAVVRLLARKAGRFEAAWPEGTELDREASTGALQERLARRYDADLVRLLNVLTDDELREVARVERIAGDGSDGLRLALWRHGATLEAGTDALLGTALQPAPLLLAGRLVHMAPPRGLHPVPPALPRPIPPPVAPTPPDDEPDSLDELLAAADRTLGVRLGARGADKGAWGALAARLLGVIERGGDEPDWRGDVEIKTVPVARDRGGRWRVTEDPAVSMASATAAPLAKLMRVLWLVRAPLPDGDATFMSWYLLDWDAEVARLVGRYLHTRPKGGAGTRGRGWYLHKGFFAEAGLLASLNGAS